MKYKVIHKVGGWYVEFANKPDMYKWLTKELDSDKLKSNIYEITQIRSEK